MCQNMAGLSIIPQPGARFLGKGGGALILLFTDFGLEGPYLGQVRAVLHGLAPGVPVVDLFADLPPFDPVSAAYLLPAYAGAPFPEDAVILAVVDPGVGTDRAPLVVRAMGRWFVGPDNGLLSRVLAADPNDGQAWKILWRPARMSASFHGRDLFAPVAGALAKGARPGDGGVLHCEAVGPARLVGADWPEERNAVIYIDRYGNGMTGMRADRLPQNAVLTINGLRVRGSRTFGDVPAGEALWYANSNGLVEIACNGAPAADAFNLQIGTIVSVGR